LNERRGATGGATAGGVDSLIPLIVERAQLSGGNARNGVGARADSKPSRRALAVFSEPSPEELRAGRRKRDAMTKTAVGGRVHAILCSGAFSVAAVYATDPYAPGNGVSTFSARRRSK